MIRRAVQPPPPPILQQGAGMAVPGNLASPSLRVVGGLIDVVILLILGGLLDLITHDSRFATGLIALLIWVSYFAYFWSQRGESIGMMVFGFRVRDAASGHYPSVGQAAVRGLVWTLEVVPCTFCLIGILAWAWMFWDPRRQALHDKITGTIVTAS
jgi:uncharacterized RDD family membrane protein YckC